MNGTQDLELPRVKRQKLSGTTATGRETSSRLFAPFRTIGLVSPTQVSFTSVPLGTTTFQITTSVGRSLQTYDLRRGLSLVFLSRPQCPETITATYAYRDRVFAAWGGGNQGLRGIWVLKRGKVIAELEIQDEFHQKINELLVIGSWIVGQGSKAIEVWRNDTYEHYTTIQAPTASAANGLGAFSGGMCHLPTFLNKVLVGCQDGTVNVYNVSTGRLIHTIQCYTRASQKVTALRSAPAVGIVAVGYSDGCVALIDAQNNDLIAELRHSSQDAISSISFRTDGIGAGEDGREDGVMATSSIQSGDVTLWDLNRGGRVMGILRGAHEITSASHSSGINKVEFLPGQAVLVSSGLDNSLRSWVFDQTPFSPVPRLLHSRSGHASPATVLKFLPASSDGSEAAGKWLLSAGQDRSLWGFSLRKDSQSSELSQGQMKRKAKKMGGSVESSSSVEDLKAPPVIAIACSLNRDGGMGAVGGAVWTNPKASNAEEANMTGWESIVTAHQGDRYARTWFWGRKKAGRWAFETGDRTPVTSVAVTLCGTFAIIGSSNGSLDMFNLQSGLHRQRFPPRPSPGRAKQLKASGAQLHRVSQIPQGHTDQVTGIVVDNLNQTVVTTSLDGLVIFWDFLSGHIIQKVSSESGSPTAVRYNSVSGLIAIACDDSCIRVFDIDSKRIVRELWGCVGHIHDYCFSHDGRWIVASSMDSVIRVFDLATGHLIDAFKTATCTSVAFSSTGEFLATAHAGSIGINIWNNKSLFLHITSSRIDEENGIVDLTQTAEFEAASQLAVADTSGDTGENITDMDDISVDQLDQGLITLSLTPSSKWQTLLNLDTIRERNKPIQPPEKPKAAPFFLGTALTNGTSQAIPDIPSQAPGQPMPILSENEKSRVSRLSSIMPSTSAITGFIQAFSTSVEKDPEPIISHLTILSPSAADLEIRSLTLNEMAPFVHALTVRLQQRRDFELVNTWMSVFLRLHAEFASEVEEIKEAVLDFRNAMSQEEARLAALVGWGRGVAEFLRSAR